MNKFVIIRNDLDTYPVILETDGLTIGRLTGNDLVLNHPTVSRTHAGIKEVKGDYWIFNLSNTNDTLLNGEIIRDVPLADGDFIQIGPFFIRPTYTDDALTLEVEMSIKPLPIMTPRTGALQQPGGAGGTGEADKTLMLDRELMAQRERTTPRGSQRISSSLMRTGSWSIPEEQALKVFWDKRKREAGKLDAESPLKPKGRRRLGKAYFNWEPTRDLQPSWSVTVLVWGAMAITALAAAAAFTFKDAYAPGPLSSAHARQNLLFTPVIAREANSASCTTCHSSQASMPQNCASCHTTRAFDPSISDKHKAAGLTCITCHAEHQGRDFRPALVANTGCTSCHHDGIVFHGKLLHTPHGGKLGYPVEEGHWKWVGITQAEWKRKGLRGSVEQHTSVEQFHLIHVAGRRQGRARCYDCHTAGYEGQAVKEGVRDSCLKCHDLTYQAASTKEAGTGCIVCHAQHGEEKGLKASLRRLAAVK